jgi:guanine deaminase
MNANCPSDYIEASAKSSLDDTATLITYIRALTPSPKTALVQPIITPRFAISCTSELLTGLGQLAAAEEAAGSPVAIQTHLAENTGEIAFTKELFADIGGEWDGSYTGVYEHFGLLGPRTVLAHCVSGIQILVTPCLALTTAA